MPTCDNIDAQGKRCRELTNEFAMFNDRILFFCPDHKKMAIVEKENGKPLEESPKPK